MIFYLQRLPEASPENEENKSSDSSRVRTTSSDGIINYTSINTRHEQLNVDTTILILTLDGFITDKTK